MLTLYAIRQIPFKYFLQPVGILGFIRTGVGTAAAAAIVTHLMTHLIAENCMTLGMELDAVNPVAAQMNRGALYGAVAKQAMLVSMKQILGWFTIGGIALLLSILTMPYIKTRFRGMPSMERSRKMIKALYRSRKMK